MAESFLIKALRCSMDDRLTVSVGVTSTFVSSLLLSVFVPHDCAKKSTPINAKTLMFFFMVLVVSNFLDKHWSLCLSGILQAGAICSQLRPFGLHSQQQCKTEKSGGGKCYRLIRKYYIYHRFSRFPFRFCFNWRKKVGERPVTFLN